MIARLLAGIFAAVLLPLGVVFCLIGLTADDVDRGEPETFALVGAPLLVLGLLMLAGFAVLSRRERRRRERRENGPRTRAQIVRARLNPGVRVGSAITVDLTVRFPEAGGPVTRTLLVAPGTRFAEGETIEIRYDPADPGNFEPVGPLLA